MGRKRRHNAVKQSPYRTDADYHLNDKNTGRKVGNSRNGHGKKTVKSNSGAIEISTPRDRQSTFEPQIIPKRTTRLENFDNAILSLYAKGMTVYDKRH